MTDLREITATEKLLPEDEGAIFPDAKLRVLHPSRVLHQPPVTHDVPQARASLHVKVAPVLGHQALASPRRRFHGRSVEGMAAPLLARLQHGERPQWVSHHGVVAVHRSLVLTLGRKIRNKSMRDGQRGVAAVVGGPGFMRCVALKQSVTVSGVPETVLRAMVRSGVRQQQVVV